MSMICPICGGTMQEQGIGSCCATCGYARVESPVAEMIEKGDFQKVKTEKKEKNKTATIVITVIVAYALINLLLRTVLHLL